ncbi:MAG TPA: heavy-metal-associated domain-containing protein [Candidatus Olsenella stercoravium]|uniref:Heavy-metal-associated domain-containing protein n=1 Tax=Candidatus Olsenella stercoravium TaxID=2838713 RepID=A0A9D2DJ79_9ACTN|nr:heavy-metal-associated domain-containing protein [Candidatus Olsenella stercoravium]
MINVAIFLAVLAVVIVAAGRYVRTLRRGGCGCGCSGGGGARVVRPSVADTNEAHYPYSVDLTVEGMHCEHCLAAVEAALDSIGGVWARASLPDEVRVLSKDPVDRAVLVRAVEAAGYRIAR